MINWILSQFRRHDYQVVGASIYGDKEPRIKQAIITKAECTRCGKEVSYPTFDFAMFDFYYLQRGCPGGRAKQNVSE